MDFLKKAQAALGQQGQHQNTEGNQAPAEGQMKQDHLDQGIDMFQERVLKEGSQQNESAEEQAKDAKIKSALQGGYKSLTGKDLNV